MSWRVLSDESAKKKREKKRKRKIKRGSKRGRYTVLGSRGRNGRKSSIHCITCGNTLSPHAVGDICSVCENKAIAGVVEKQTQRTHEQLNVPLHNLAKSQMDIPEMTK